VYHQTLELDSLNLAVDQARSEYRHALELCRDRVGQADTLGSENVDAILVRARAFEQLKAATEKYTSALSAVTEGVMRYSPR
jgi:hypothetical protein